MRVFSRTAAHDPEETFRHIDGDDRRKAAGRDHSSGDPALRRASAIGAAGWAVATLWAGLASQRARLSRRPAPAADERGPPIRVVFGFAPKFSPPSHTRFRV